MNKIQGNQLNVFQIRSPTEGGSRGVATPQGGGAGATPPLTGFDLKVKGPTTYRFTRPRWNATYDIGKWNDLRMNGSNDLT